MFEKLVLSGGGPRGLAMIGALHYAKESGHLENINEYWGTSIGGLICFLLNIGYTPFEMFYEFYQQEGLIEPFHMDITNITEMKSLYPIGNLGKSIEKYMYNKNIPVDFTFADLFQLTNKKLCIIGTDSDNIRQQIFSIDKTPTVKVLDAIEITCAIPFLFTKKKLRGISYVDGGFSNNYPIDLADDGISKVLGISSIGGNSLKILGNAEWIYKLMLLPFVTLYREKIERSSSNCFNIQLDIQNISFLELAPHPKKKLETFLEGHRQARDNFRNYNCSKLSCSLKYEPTTNEIEEAIKAWQDW